MRFRRLGASGLEVSEISFGTWLTVAGGVERAQAVRCIQAAFEHGITLFDTANQYGGGEAERVLGAALRGFPRWQWRKLRRQPGLWRNYLPPRQRHIAGAKFHLSR